jgi:hypothetical protein
LIRPIRLGAIAKMNTQATAKSPAAFDAAELAWRTIQRRAVEAVIWGIPVVNYDLMFQSLVRSGKGGANQILYWSGPYILGSVPGSQQN